MKAMILRLCISKLYFAETEAARTKLTKWEVGFLDHLLRLPRWSPKQTAIAKRILSQKGA